MNFHSFSIIALKATAIFVAGITALLVAHRSAAATRRLICTCTLAGALIVPLTLLVPEKALLLHIAFAGFRAESKTAPGPSPWSPGDELTAIWVAGTAVLALRILFGHYQLRRLLDTATPHETQIASFVPVFAADVTVPIAAGLFRPVILLPREAQTWPDWQVSAALHHEIAHIRHNDLWTTLLAHLGCAIWWFHPLAWKLRARLVHEQETACDDAVLDSGFEPARYAEALLEVARHTTSNLLSGCSMKNQSNLKTRIARLLNTNVARKTTGTTARSIGIAFAALLLAIGMVSFVRPGRAEPAQSGEPYQVGGEVNAPRILSKVEPAYTDEARDAKIEGTVVLTVVIDSDGTAHDFTLVKSVDPGLDQNAIDAVRQWEFAPATLHGEPVAVRATIEINFRLQ